MQKNATEKWTPKNQDAKKCKKCKSIFIAKIKMQKLQENANQFAQKCKKFATIPVFVLQHSGAIEISIFSAFYTMKRRNNGT